MGRVTDRRRVVRVDDARVVERPDTLAVEEPLEIRADGRPLAVTMRTPGHDVELALGFLLTEGLVGPDGVHSAINCADNVVDVTLTEPLADDVAARGFYVSSSCGICGKASIDAVTTEQRWPVAGDVFAIDADVLVSLPDKLRAAQKTFDRTGGLHAAGLFTSTGELLCIREDVGRHNAVDKVVGWALTETRLPLRGTILQVSGRASFELVQKALMAGIPAMAAVSAPSSLAAEMATGAGLTLVGFLRGTSFNVYADAGRLALPVSS
ncbi:MAG TPA: formate dehydrogenase accessory sulfurtransferase FdhD [Mycobacteriales bacterium]|nr:formate dehydrogenase accessory sulfurtransferase FdhD [Mycobacteriales bacterium]